MALSVEDQVATHLSLSVVEPRLAGTMSPGLEAAALFDSIASVLLLKPRTALWFEHLARNNLVWSLRSELAALDELAKCVEDVANPSFKIDGEAFLISARTALLQLEGLPRLDSGPVALSAYDRSIQGFLNKGMSKNVRKRGATSLSRSADEALQSLPGSFSTLKDAHAQTLLRLYSLMVGIENFITAPISALLSSTTISRARADLEEVLQAVQDGVATISARDLALRLVVGRAAVRTMASPPSIFDPTFSVSTAKTIDTAPVAVSAPAPFTSSNTPLAITHDGQTTSYILFPTNTAFLPSSDLVFPLSIPSDYYLFLSIDGTPVKIPVDGTFSALTDLLTKLNASGAVTATAFAGAENRFMLSKNGSSEMEVLPAVYELDPLTTTGTETPYVLSAHDALVLRIGQVGTQDVTADAVAFAIETLYPQVLASVVGGKVTLTGASTSELLISGPASFGFPASTFGETSMVESIAVDHRTVVQVGDMVTVEQPGADEVRTITEVAKESVTLNSPVLAFSGRASGVSGLVLSHKALLEALAGFMKTWSSSRFVSSLDALDGPLAALLASQGPAQRGEVGRLLGDLRTPLTTLLNQLLHPSTMPPVGGAVEERVAAEGILSSLLERRFDRAADLLLRCDIVSLLEVDSDSASYAGAFMKASSVYARNGGVRQQVDQKADTGIVAENVR